MVTGAPMSSTGPVALRKFVSTRADFAPSGPVATPFPDLVATPQPSDSPAPSVAALVPLAHDLPQRRRLVLNRPGLPPSTPGAWEPDHRRSLPPDMLCGETGVSQVTGRSLYARATAAIPGRSARAVNAWKIRTVSTSPFVNTTR